MKLNRSGLQRLYSGFALLIRLGLGCLFLWSSLPKIRQSYDFLSSVYGYEIVGPKIGLLVAMVLPWLELLMGICLIGGIFVSGALLVCIGMAAVFAFALSSALWRGLKISCGCFGDTSDVINIYTVIRAVVILLLGSLAYLEMIIFLPGTERQKAG
jgi:uncharacterized membrane protein YphA (DoxX/SURF4 family)